MDWITDKLAIGNYLDAGNVETLQDAKIRCVLTLDGNLRDARPENLGVERIESFSIIDGPGNDAGFFLRILAVLENRVSDSAPVLVACHAGQSRSAALVTAYLMRTKSLASSEAFELVRAERPMVKIQPGLLTLLDYVDEE
ncbi:MAG: dual specificity protein phosphatase [Planctomycetota bacterium]